MATRPTVMACVSLAFVSMFVGCTRRTLREQTIWGTHSNDGPVDIDAVVAKYPELDGVIISAPEYMEELERVRKQLEAEGEPPRRAEYRVQPGISLRLEVSGSGEFTREVLVGPDGWYDFPLIGVVYLQDKTLAEVREELTTRLSRYIKNPQVSVNTSYIGYGGGGVVNPQYAIGRVTVLGAASEGVFGITGREKISDILAYSSALGDGSAWRDIRIIRQCPGKRRPRMIIVDGFNLVKLGDLAQDVPLADRDIVYVPPHFSLGEHIGRDWDLVMKYTTGSQNYDQLVQYFEGRLRGRIKPLRDASD